MNDPVIYRTRAAFGVGFIVLGIVTLWRVAITPVPNVTKIVGILLGGVMIGLGAARIIQYRRHMRRS